MRRHEWVGIVALALFIAFCIMFSPLETIKVYSPHPIPGPDLNDYWYLTVPQVPAPLDHAPKLVYIGHATYQVRYSSAWFLHEHGVEAFTDTVGKIIYLNGASSSSDWRDSLVHELLHAMMVEASGWDRLRGWAEERQDPIWSRDHKWITPVTPIMLQTIQRNPSLMRCLGQQVKIKEEYEYVFSVKN